jgi:hypothetical protein
MAGIKGQNQVGGVAGSSSGKIYNCSNEGIVSGTDMVGGVIGWNTGSLTFSSNNNSVSGKVDIGGVVGKNQNQISQVYSIGNISGKGRVGGVVGLTYRKVKDSYSIGDIAADSIVGGFAGYTVDSLSNCFCVGDVSGIEDVGCFIGEIYKSNIRLIKNSFWNIDYCESDTSLSVAIPITSAEATNKSNFPNWDFENVWDIDGTTNMGYPFLRSPEDISSYIEERSFQEEEFFVYPNPTTGSIYLNGFTEEVTFYTLYSIDGRILEQDTHIPDMFLDSYQPGIYILILDSGNKSRSFKLIKQ